MVFSSLRSLICSSSNASDRTTATCIFCDVSVKTGFSVVFEDETFIAFRDHKPATQHHIQVIPKQHIRSVRSLSKQDADMVIAMKTIGHTLLDEVGVDPSSRKMGFHIPPFNSVNHLHLHVQALPYLSGPGGLKYPVSTGSGSNSKGYGWFVEVNQTIQILQKGRRVGVMPC